jgi:ATP-dependent exoDNAse (exonuclease V) beta subunit
MYELLDEWDCSGAESREVGTFLHAQIEAYFSNKPVLESTRFIYKGTHIRENKIVSIREELKYFKNFLKENPITPFRIEWHICDLNLGIAGTVDLLCRNGNSFDLYDWKRSKKASPNETIWDYGINGLEDIPNIGYYRYAIQQNLYRYILEKNYGIKIANMYIVVLHPINGKYVKYPIKRMDKEIRIIVNKLS